MEGAAAPVLPSCDEEVGEAEGGEAEGEDDEEGAIVDGDTRGVAMRGSQMQERSISITPAQL